MSESEISDAAEREEIRLISICDEAARSLALLRFPRNADERQDLMVERDNLRSMLDQAELDLRRFWSLKSDAELAEYLAQPVTHRSIWLEGRA